MDSSLPVGKKRIFLDDIAQPDNAGTPQDPHLPPTFTSRHITRPKSKQPPEGEL